MADRYRRNRSSISEAEQGRLAASRVLLVGLGGLGGSILEHLARLGVGHIVGVDGDVFEESNLNRQVLATEQVLGQSKAEVAAQRVAAINSEVVFVPVARFVAGMDFEEMVRGVDVVVDALGGLEHRKALQQAASKAGKPLVAAGIAGFTGWVAVVRPGERGPADLFTPEHGDGPTVEEQLGNLAPVAGLAASLQASHTLRLLLGHPVKTPLLLFDLEDMEFYPVTL